MKIAILSCEPKCYSTMRLVQAAQERGHEVDVINTLQCYMNISTTQLSIYYQGKPLPQYDVIIPRIGASITFYGTAIVRQFEMMGVYTVNPSLAITRSRDKWRSLQILSRHKVAIPRTGFTHDSANITDLIEKVEGYPIIIKLLEGTQGKGVVLAQNRNSATSVIEAFNRLKANILLQEYMVESKGKDIRCFVVGTRVVAAMQRQAKKGEFRSNLHRGGTAKPISITPKERAIAVKAAQVMGLNVAGVDILRTQKGPMVLEVNSSPGLRGIEGVTEKDIAGYMMEFIETQVSQKKRKTKKKKADDNSG